MVHSNAAQFWIVRKSNAHVLTQAIIVEGDDKCASSEHQLHCKTFWRRWATGKLAAR